MDALFIIKTYCLLDDTLKVMGHRDHHPDRLPEPRDRDLVDALDQMRQGNLDRAEEMLAIIKKLEAEGRKMIESGTPRVPRDQFVPFDQSHNQPCHHRRKAVAAPDDRH